MNNAELITAATQAQATSETDRLAIACLDYTRLNDNDTEDDIRTLCQQALTPLGHVAAVCVMPEFVSFARGQLRDTGVRVATVVNFPHGNGALDEVLADTKLALFDGADEIDVVFPYRDFLAGKTAEAQTFIAAVKKSCGDKTLKVILETGTFPNTDTLRAASDLCLEAGADFLKTSTGKIAVGATLESALVLLQAVQHYRQHSTRLVGVKISGGVRAAQDAARYVYLAQAILGTDFTQPQQFRLGASGLLQNIVQQTNQQSSY